MGGFIQQFFSNKYFFEVQISFSSNLFYFIKTSVCLFVCLQLFTLWSDRLDIFYTGSHGPKLKFPRQTCPSAAILNLSLFSLLSTHKFHIRVRLSHPQSSVSIFLSCPLAAILDFSFFSRNDPIFWTGRNMSCRYVCPFHRRPSWIYLFLCSTQYF